MEPDWRLEERVPVLKMLTLADLFSLGNGLLGVLSIISALGDETRLAFSLITLAVLFDGVDGGVARLGYGGGRLGPKLDSASDLVSFVVAPTILFWSVYRDQSWLPFLSGDMALLVSAGAVFVFCALYFFSGVLRLARFDYLRGGERHDYFLGVTTPGAATVLASLALLELDVVPSLILVALAAILMTSRVRLPKVRGVLAPISAAVLIVAASFGDTFHNLGPLLLLSFFFAYLVFGPGYVRRHLEEPDESAFSL